MEIKKRYVVRFKRKDLRDNRHDDKITILKNAVNMDPRRITRTDERVLAVHEVGDNSSRLAEDSDKIVDINEFQVPIAIASLSLDQVEDLKKNKDVRWVYEDQPAGIKLIDQIEILPIAAEMDAVHKEYVTENVKRIKAHNAWTYKTGYAVKVCVMDTGIDKTHPDLTANFKGGATFIGGDSAAPGSRNDAEGGFHGTGCAGIIGAVRGNGQGVVGIAPDCFLYDARVFSLEGRPISMGELTAAYVWCGNNSMDVVSMSFGFDAEVKYNEKNKWQPFMHDQNNAITAAYTKGTLFVGGAGNGDEQGRGDGGKRSNRWADQFYPAAYDAVICVSAIYPNDSLAAFSNTGIRVAFTCPGESNHADPPYGLTTYAGRRQTLKTIYKNAYGWFNGTSMACPHVAGVLALGFSAYKPESCVTAYNGLGTVRPRQNIIARTTGFTADGLGSPNLNKSSPEIGYGLPNAERLVRTLLNIDDEGNSSTVRAWPASIQPTTKDGIMPTSGPFA